MYFCKLFLNAIILFNAFPVYSKMMFKPQTTPNTGKNCFWLDKIGFDIEYSSFGFAYLKYLKYIPDPLSIFDLIGSLADYYLDTKKDGYIKDFLSSITTNDYTRANYLGRINKINIEGEFPSFLKKCEKSIRSHQNIKTIFYDPAAGNYFIHTKGPLTHRKEVSDVIEGFNYLNTDSFKPINIYTGGNEIEQTLQHYLEEILLLPHKASDNTNTKNIIIVGLEKKDLKKMIEKIMKKNANKKSTVKNISFDKGEGHITFHLEKKLSLKDQKAHKCLLEEIFGKSYFPSIHYLQEIKEEKDTQEVEMRNHFTSEELREKQQRLLSLREAQEKVAAMSSLS